jgi:hypothetical protein
MDGWMKNYRYKSSDEKVLYPKEMYVAEESRSEACFFFFFVPSLSAREPVPSIFWKKKKSMNG